MPRCRDCPAHKIKQDEAKFSQNILNIIPKNPEVEHVSSQMPDSGMQKHGSVNGWISGNRIVNQFVGNEGVVFIKHAGVDRKVDPINKYHEVQYQEKECEEGEVF